VWQIKLAAHRVDGITGNKRAAFTLFGTVIVFGVYDSGSKITVADLFRPESTGYPQCG
jgi:hypothetical protein